MAHTSTPTAPETALQMRRLGILTDCHSRMESLTEAIDHLRQRSPRRGARDWERSLNELQDTKFEITLHLDKVSSSYDLFGRIDEGTSALLAEVKRLEGRLANLCAQFQIRPR